MLALIAPGPGSKEHKLIGRATQVVFVTEDVAAKFREWSERGVRFRHTPRLRRVTYDSQPIRRFATEQSPIWGGVFTRFEDIDRNSFALVSFDAVSRAVEAQRRAGAEKLESERRAAQELEIARQVQARLFPQTLPTSTTLEYAGVCIQARQVGGDYYDFLNLGQERLGLVVGDIAGKGIAAALLMANLQANLRSQCAIALDQPQQFSAIREPALLRKYGRQRLRHALLRRVRRQATALALRQLRASLRSSFPGRSHAGTPRFHLLRSRSFQRLGLLDRRMPTVLRATRSRSTPTALPNRSTTWEKNSESSA